ncbi:hypothetical protein CRG98_016745 [Punica granatum]|nr:hypothetical protein CRG98_016745 [Punica granatum]
MHERHEQWMAQYGRTYSDNAEKERRFQIFKENVVRIESFNAIGDKPYELSINRFTDLTNEEFRAMHNGLKVPDVIGATLGSTPFEYGNVTSVPSSVDWREKGAVTPIKNQEECGCCWAFSVVGAVEGIHAITTGKLVSLSEQELVDCDVGSENQGCNGGWMDSSFEFVVQHGLTSEANYPYAAADEMCNVKEESEPVARISGYKDVPANDEEALMKAVSFQPVSVAIDASGFEFQFYKGGIFKGPCGTVMDHAVLVVGYGTTEDGVKYWLVKNSWGTEWGEHGYIRMQRLVKAKEGLCGIAMKASYPTA